MTPKYSRKFISRIGDTLISDESTLDEKEEAIQLIGEWRTLHLQPLNTFQSTLRKYVHSVDSNGIVAQRLKRIPTIIDKLHRYKDMELGRMHDIGGLRAIVENIQKVRELEAKYTQARSKHILKRKYDYINAPKDSGYRGIHLVYENQNPKNLDSDGLLVEIQLRTQLQHLWATAVETVGFFYKEALKSSQGNKVWLDFFHLVSAVFAYEENELPAVAMRHLSKEDLIFRTKQFNKDHGILRQLDIIQIPKILKNVPFFNKASYWILETSAQDTNVKVRPFLKEQQESASLVYRQLEQSPNCKSGKSHVVLVSVDSVKKLEMAYPNFFLDVQDFTQKIKSMIQLQ